MNLQELEARSPAKHYTKVLEQYFGRKVSLRNLSENDTKRLLSRVRNLIAERRADPSIHYSERDPKFIQLMMVEQALKYRLKENTQYAPSGATNNAGAMTQPAGGSTTTPTPAEKQKVKSQQLQAAQKIKDPKLQQTMKKSISGQTLSKDEQQSMAGAMMGSPIQNENWNRHWRIQISESEIQQAQVILAAQDLVDQVQKMIEQCTSVQFKDLPALVNQVKNEVGYDKAVQFNQDSGTAFSTLVQSMQTAKLQLEAAVGIITGQQSSIPSVGSPNDTGMTPPPSPDEDMDFDMDVDFDEPEMGGEETTLGRARAK
jgi:hypothetical protein